MKKIKEVENHVKKISTLAMEEIDGLMESFSRSKDFQYISSSHCISDFLKFRQNSIASFMSEIRRLVKECGRELGLDTFTSSLSWLVGQNYSLLRDKCHWIKPMIYCKCFGPICIPADVIGLIRGLQEMKPKHLREMPPQYDWSVL